MADRNVVGSIYGREEQPSIDASYQVSVSDKKILKNQQYLYRDNCILNTVYLHKSYLSFNRDFLEINQSETRIACSGHVC
jgi:hypothetical protein